jgi:hypothetical protein
LAELRADPSRLKRLGRRLEALARGQLGDDAELEWEDGGGLVARKGVRSVDYRMESVVARALEDAGSIVARLWA